jgi:hypothetical protein
MNTKSVLINVRENTVGAIKNGQPRETGNIGHTRQRKTKQKHNTICWTPLFFINQTPVYSVDRSWSSEGSV